MPKIIIVGGVFHGKEYHNEREAEDMIHIVKQLEPDDVIYHNSLFYSPIITENGDVELWLEAKTEH